MRDAYREHAPPPDLATHVACTWTRAIVRDTVEPIIGVSYAPSLH